MAIVVYPHDIEFDGPVSAALLNAGIRLTGHPEDQAIHIMPYGDSIAIIPDPEALPLLFLKEPLDAKGLVSAVRAAAELLDARRAARDAKGLLEIARGLGAEHDRQRLYRLIVRTARELTFADAGTLYMLEERDGQQMLRFAIAQTGPHDDVGYEGGSVPLSPTSIAGSVALSRKPVRLADVYKDAVSRGLQFDRSFDEARGYRTKSMLCVSLTSYSGNPVGVLQLMNRKPTFEMPLLSTSITESAVMPFDEHDEELVIALASHSGLALSNAALMEELWKSPPAS